MQITQEEQHMARIKALLDIRHTAYRSVSLSQRHNHMVLQQFAQELQLACVGRQNGDAPIGIAALPASASTAVVCSMTALRLGVQACTALDASIRQQVLAWLPDTLSSPQQMEGKGHSHLGFWLVHMG